MLPIKNGRILNITLIIFKSIIKILIIPSANNISAFIKYIFFFFFSCFSSSLGIIHLSKSKPVSRYNRTLCTYQD